MTEPRPEDAVVKETLAEKLGTTPGEPPQGGSLLTQFVVFPLVIVIIAVAIFGFFKWLGQDTRSYEDYLAEISSGWKRKRPEAAYQLQFRLADKDDPLRKTADVPKTVAVFLAAKKDRAEDPSVRRFLAVVLGHLEDARAVPALLEAVSSDEPDQETRLNATWALGRCREKSAVPALVALLDDPFEGQRKAACFALGDVGDPAACDPLAKKLSDPVIDVRWNAALALARLADDRAMPTLLAMLDRRLLDSITGPRDADHLPMDERQREAVMINALRGVLCLATAAARRPEAAPSAPGAPARLTPALVERVSAVADADPNLRVRDAAMRVRDELRTQATSGAKSP